MLNYDITFLHAWKKKKEERDETACARVRETLFVTDNGHSLTKTWARLSRLFTQFFYTLILFSFLQSVRVIYQDTRFLSINRVSLPSIVRDERSSFLPRIIARAKLTARNYPSKEKFVSTFSSSSPCHLPIGEIDLCPTSFAKKTGEEIRKQLAANYSGLIIQHKGLETFSIREISMIIS